MNTLPILMHQMPISTTQVSGRKSWKSEKQKKKNVKTVKEPSDENQSAMKLSQRAMPEGDNPSF
jgi:hypothetical protein